MSLDINVFSDLSNEVNNISNGENVGLYFKFGSGYNYLFCKIKNPTNNSSTNEPTFKGIEYNNNKIHTINVNSTYLNNGSDSTTMKIEINNSKINDIRTAIENI